MTPGATWGSIAYTQYGHLALAQIVSIAGLGGLTFLVAWFAAVVNWVWERGFVWQDVRKGVGLYAGIMAAV
jgi:apolipoprotein N-acyltransferase